MGGRRKRESLLDNVDPLDAEDEQPAIRDEGMAATSSAQQTETAGAGTSGSWTGYQNGSTHRADPADPAASSKEDTGGAWSSPSTSDDNGWGARPKPVTEDWGWGAAAAKSRYVAASSNGASSQAWDETGNGAGTAGPGTNRASAWHDESGEAGPDTAGEIEEDDFPDIVELQPQEVVRSTSFPANNFPMCQSLCFKLGAQPTNIFLIIDLLIVTY